MTQSPVLDSLKKSYGDNVITSAKFFLDKPKQIIPVSPSFDCALNGGIVDGSWIIIGGPPKFGKTTLALQMASQCQKPEYGGRDVYFFNIEGRLKSMNLSSANGLNLDKFNIIESNEEKIFSAQDYLTIASQLLLSEKRIVVIIDSFSALVHEKELAEGIGTSTRGGQQVLLSQFCRQMSNVVSVKNSIVIGITHMMANTSGYGAAVIEKGGYSIQYQVDIKLRAKKREFLENGEKSYGQKVSWIAECSALGAMPNQEFDSYIKFGKGIDYNRELLDLSKTAGLVTNKGAWYIMDFMANHPEMLEVKTKEEATKKCAKIQGAENASQFLEDNPIWLKTLDADYRKLVYGAA